MRAVLAIARLGLVVGLGLAVIWGYTSPEPTWAEAPPRRPPVVNFADLHRPAELERLRLGAVAEAAAPLIGAEPAAKEEDAEQREPPPFDGLAPPPGAFERARESETLRLEAEQDDEGVWLIGYGHRLRAQPSWTITAAEADDMLREDLAAAEDAVRSSVAIPLNQNEYGALVEFARSIGAENFSHTLVATLLNAGDRDAAADAFMLWTKVRVDGALVDSAELVAQRERTQELFRAPPTG